MEATFADEAAETFDVEAGLAVVLDGGAGGHGGMSADVETEPAARVWVYGEVYRNADDPDDARRWRCLPSCANDPFVWELVSGVPREGDPEDGWYSDHDVPRLVPVV